MYVVAKACTKLDLYGKAQHLVNKYQFGEQEHDQREEID